MKDLLLEQTVELLIKRWERENKRKATRELVNGVRKQMRKDFSHIPFKVRVETYERLKKEQENHVKNRKAKRADKAAARVANQANAEPKPSGEPQAGGTNGGGANGALDSGGARGIPRDEGSPEALGAKGSL